jgi:hypothetical protein
MYIYLIILVEDNSDSLLIYIIKYLKEVRGDNIQHILFWNILLIEFLLMSVEYQAEVALSML